MTAIRPPGGHRMQPGKPGALHIPPLAGDTGGILLNPACRGSGSLDGGAGAVAGTPGGHRTQPGKPGALHIPPLAGDTGGILMNPACRGGRIARRGCGSHIFVATKPPVRPNYESEPRGRGGKPVYPVGGGRVEHPGREPPGDTGCSPGNPGRYTFPRWRGTQGASS